MNMSVVWTRQEKAIDIGFPKLKNKFWWNPSIAWHKKELWVSYRGYEKPADNFRGYRSPLRVGKLKDDKLIEYKLIEPRNAPEHVMECGIEDVRLWSDGKDLYGIGVILSQFSNKRLNVRLGEIKIDYENGGYDLIKDFGQPLRTPEKNWSPIEGRPHEYMYSVEKLYKDKKITPTTLLLRANHQVIHNGTNLVKIDDGYIAIAHQRTFLRDRKGCYPNFFIKYDENLCPTHCTDWFVFQDYMYDEVQFMGGMARLDRDTLGITVGLDRITARVEAQYKSLLYKVKISGIDWQPYSPTPLRRGYYKKGDK